MEENLENSRLKLANAFKKLEKIFENKLNQLKSNQTDSNITNLILEKEVIEKKYEELKKNQKEITSDLKSSIALVKQMLNNENANS